MNTDKQKPLYQRLNEQRTNGNWSISPLDGRIVTYPTNQSISAPIGVMTPCYTKSKHIFSETDIEKVKANAEYTALAVNNLHLLAEALEKAMQIIERLDEEYSDATDRHSSYTRGEYNSLKEALARIS